MHDAEKGFVAKVLRNQVFKEEQGFQETKSNLKITCGEGRRRHGRGHPRSRQGRHRRRGATGH